MKRYFFPVMVILVLSFGRSYGFEISGLKPLAPHGVFSTFSTSSLERGKISLSVDAEVSLEPDFYRFFLSTAYGITDAVELNMNIPYILGEDSKDGFEDISFGLKHRFFREGKYGPSLAYVVTASVASGIDEFSTDGRFGIGALVSKKVGPVNGHINLFYVIPVRKEFDNEVALLAGIDFAAAHNFKILAELYSKTSFETGKVESVEGRIGYRIKTSKYVYTTVGAGFDFKNRNPETRLMFSVTYVAPFKKREK